jgi:hypothetical protein
MKAYEIVGLCFLICVIVAFIGFETANLLQCIFFEAIGSFFALAFVVSFLAKRL